MFSEIRRRKASLKLALSKDDDYEKIVIEHLLNIDSFLFLDNLDAENNLLSIIKDYFQLDTENDEIYLVGSAKTGYSLSSAKKFREIDYEYNKTKNPQKKSDIDVAIISNKLYLELQSELYHFTNGYRDSWRESKYHQIREYHYRKRNNKDKYNPEPIYEIEYNLFKYLSKGWFRIDFKPDSFEVCRCNKRLEDLKKIVFKEYDRKLGVAIYQSREYFLSYHLDNMRNISLQIERDPEILE